MRNYPGKVLELGRGSTMAKTTAINLLKMSLGAIEDLQVALGKRTTRGGGLAHRRKICGKKENSRQKSGKKRAATTG